MKKSLVIILMLILTTLLNANKVDSTTGLINDIGLGEVKENCTVCHTGRFIVVNGGDKKFWKTKIRVMQDAYGLWKIDKEAEKRMLKYLVKNYAEKKRVSIND